MTSLGQYNFIENISFNQFQSIKSAKRMYIFYLTFPMKRKNGRYTDHHSHYRGSVQVTGDSSVMNTCKPMGSFTSSQLSSAELNGSSQFWTLGLAYRKSLFTTNVIEDNMYLNIGLNTNTNLQRNTAKHKIGSNVTI